MAYRDYDVLSFFINVGAGDSAIHILRQRNTENVEAAVLIDGGRSTSQRCIEGAIHTIRAALNRNFQFTSIVVTHWDEDHYAGLMHMLYNQWVDIQNTPQLPDWFRPYIHSDETTFYCPWMDVGALEKINHNMTIEGNQEKTRYWLFFRLSENSKWHRICRAVVSTFAMGYDLFTHYDNNNVLEKPFP
ncbi:hypothetical protein NCS52_00381900 [Fusarium sp. LHS14.1]|nr:hypothetical protein NCS52_00381900 [Fusarium sp. LHS14.1]